MKPLLILSYVGTEFCGYQVQPGKRTVHATLQDSIEAVLGKRYAVIGCSRTDSGVHAKEFCATLEAKTQELSVSLDRLPLALNAHLPRDLRVIGIRAVPASFHVRYCEHEKEYVYRIWNSPYPNPFEEDRALFVPYPLDCERMQQAADLLVGEHDFAAFQAAGSKITEDTVRCVSLFCVEREGDLVLLRVRANGFLYHMVRIFAGTLLEVARGKRAPKEMTEILASKNRRCAGFTAPACGLYLNRVIYPESVFSSQ